MTSQPTITPFDGDLPKITLPDGRVVETPCVEYLTQKLRWRWLLDSYEGGEIYRTASYGMDVKGMPVRNLIRHKREYPLQQDASYSLQSGRPLGTDQAAQATDDDYELRRARTPVPTFMSEAIGEHLSKIYNQEISRKGPKALEDWWADVDGRGTSMDQWMADVFAPLFVAFGQLDFHADHPQAPEDEPVSSRADELRLGLDKCLGSYVLPTNIPWYKVDRQGRYVELIVRENDDDGRATFRYWNAKLWATYDAKGKEIKRFDHNYGFIPIGREFCKRRPSCRHVGLPPYEVIAEIQREYYNRDSELILSDSIQAHPVVQGPEDFIKPDSVIGIGPGYVMPMKKDASKGGYQGWEVLDFPKGAADSIRTNKNDLRDTADRAACLTKPAGSAGTSGGTMGQSAASKRLDASTGNELLGKLAATLQHVEEDIAAMVLQVLKIKPGEDEVKIGYPRQFDLWNADELMTAIQNFELIIGQVGDAPETEQALLCKAVRLMLPGCDDEEYAEMDAELEALLETRQADKKAQREANRVTINDPNAVDSNSPNDDTSNESDPAATSAPGYSESE